MPSNFRRLGWVLVIFGAADTALLAWSLQQKLLYPSPFNVFAIAAGVLMLRGSLTTAALVRWTAAFTLAATLAAVLAVPFLVDPGLLTAVWRLHPVASAAGVAALGLFLGVIAWMQFELERDVVRAALERIGKRWRLWIAGLTGLVSVVVLAGCVAILLRGPFATEALARAHGQLGPGYRSQVVALGVFFSRRGPYVAASVAGWNEREIRLVPLRWDLP